MIDPKARDFTRTISLSIIRDSKDPIGAIDIAEKARSLGSVVGVSSFSPSLTQWWKKADKGWEHVHRTSVKHSSGGVAYLYYFNGDTTRQPEIVKLTAKQKKKLRDEQLGEIEKAPVRQRVKEVPNSNLNSNSETYAKVLFEDSDDGFVVLMDQNRNIIKGKYLE